MTNTPIKGWIPYKLKVEGGQLFCHWLNTGQKTFSEPFFDETIIKYKTAHERYIKFPSVSDIAVLHEWADHLEAIQPAAIIFHVSRCGSTLVSQLLSTFPGNIMLAEVPFFDDILRLPFKDDRFDKTTVNKLLTDALKFYGQDKTGLERRVFIKADSWHLFFYDQLRALFPSVPFVVIYRSPDEVFRSHDKVSGIQMVPGLIEPDLFGFDAASIYNMGRDKYMASVLESFFSKILEIADADDNVLLINYNDGPMTMMKRAAEFVDVAFSDADLEKMKERSLYHSKKPEELFSEEAITSVSAHLGMAMELYQKLEAKRIAVLE